jgi:hypothetical protein
MKTSGLVKSIEVTCPLALHDLVVLSTLLDGEIGAWRSLVAHLPWEQGVGRSNRLAPIE